MGHVGPPPPSLVYSSDDGFPSHPIGSVPEVNDDFSEAVFHLLAGSGDHCSCMFEMLPNLAVPQ